MHSKELVLLSLTPTCGHTSIIQADINLTNESCVSEVWSLERDGLEILDADLIANNAKGMSVTTSLRMNTNFSCVQVSLSCHKVELAISGL